MVETLGCIEQIKNIIISEVDPDRIILFGSRSRGDFREDSDFDILILKKNLQNERKVTSHLYLEFYKRRLNISVDLIAADTDKYDKLADITGYIYKVIKREGKTIYERT